jgi:hypothetical protein
MAQQIEVRAVHEIAAAAAETNGAAAQFVALPSTSAGMELRPNRTLAIWRYEQRSSQPPRPRSTKSEPAALLHCQGVRRRGGGAARQGVEQAACRFSAHGEAVVQRDDDGG